MKTYKIGNREYQLKKLVMGQVIELAEYLAQAEIDFQGVKDVKEFIVKNLKHLPRLFAIVLTPKDTPLHKRSIEKEEAYLFTHLEYDQMVEVLQDFLDLHNLIELIEKITSLIEGITSQLTTETSEAR